MLVRVHDVCDDLCYVQSRVIDGGVQCGFWEILLSNVMILYIHDNAVVNDRAKNTNKNG